VARATPGDLELAERLIMALVDRLPADSAIDVAPLNNFMTRYLVTK
jgi:hypothetical protein